MKQRSGSFEPGEAVQMGNLGVPGEAVQMGNLGVPEETNLQQTIQ